MLTFFSFDYGYNQANQRTAVTNKDSARWLYAYDSLGQAILGKKYWNDGTPVAGQQYEFEFDHIGNRIYAAHGGNELGTNLRGESYSTDIMNQYSQRTVFGGVDILGSATNTATVTVNNRPTYRKGEYFRCEYLVTNTAALYLSLTNLGVLNNGTNADIVATNIGYAFIPQTPQIFRHDADGNLTNDGRFAYYWDAENRLTNITSLPTPLTASMCKLDLVYDYQGRRVQKMVSTNNGGGWVSAYTNRFIYDGWNLVAILDGANTVLYSFQWSLDARGTFQGAGGVGGLLAMKVHSGSLAGTYFYAYDGNHNVVGLVNGSTGAPVARYEYGPFGEVIRASGLLASSNPFQFSTKLRDRESDLLYYGYRSYNPFTGRWLSRDPIGETGGKNLYGFVRSNPVGLGDRLGKSILDWFCCKDECTCGHIRIDNVETATVPSSINPETYDHLKDIVHDIHGLEKISEWSPDNPWQVIVGEVVSDAKPDVTRIFNDVFQSVLQKGIVNNYTKVHFSKCQKVSCFVFWKQCKWVNYDKIYPPKWKKGAHGDMGEGDYSGLDSALNGLAQDIDDNISEIIKEYQE